MDFNKIKNMQTPNWFNMTDGDTTARIDIDGVIGGSFFGGGVTAENFVKQARDLKAQTLEIHINSNGGSVSDGLKIYNFLKACGKTVKCYVDGMAASIASIIAMAGDEIIMPENALMLVHNPWSFTMGNAAALRANAADLDKIQANLVNIYKDRSGQTLTQIQNLMDGPENSDGTLMTASEAMAFGLITAIEPNKQAAACIGADIWAGVPAALVKAETKPEEEETEEEEKPPVQAEEEKPEEETEEEEKPPVQTEEEKPEEETEEKEKPPVQTEEEKPEEETEKEDPEKLKAQVAAAKKEVAAANARLAKMMDKGLTPNPEPVATNTTRTQALQICGGNYTKARKTYPLAYNQFMKEKTGK